MTKSLSKVVCSLLLVSAVGGVAEARDAFIEPKLRHIRDLARKQPVRGAALRDARRVEPDALELYYRVQSPAATRAFMRYAFGRASSHGGVQGGGFVGGKYIIQLRSATGKPKTIKLSPATFDKLMAQ